MPKRSASPLYRPSPSASSAATKKPTNHFASCVVRFSFFCREGGQPPVALRVMVSPDGSRGRTEKGGEAAGFEHGGTGTPRHGDEPGKTTVSLCHRATVFKIPLCAFALLRLCVEISTSTP